MHSNEQLIQQGEKNPVFIRFERGRDDAVALTLGPFPWATITYKELRVGFTGHTIALWDDDYGDWTLADDVAIPTGLLDSDDCYWSDITIYSARGVELTEEEKAKAGQLHVRLPNDEAIDAYYWRG